MKKIDIKKLTSDDVKKELNRVKYNNKFNSVLRSTIYILIILAAIGALVATFITPVLQINTNSMSPKYKEGDIVLAIKTKRIRNGDVIAFYHGNKIIISRVIGVSSDWIKIDEEGIVSVNGKVLKENYAKNIDTVLDDIKYPYQVGASSYFVLNDDRSNTNDSRNKDIGVVNYNDLIGKIIFKVWSK